MSKQSRNSKRSDHSSRPRNGITEKRRQKEQELREMMRKAKEQRKQKEKRVKVL